jgi:hypothetical protein
LLLLLLLLWVLLLLLGYTKQLLLLLLLLLPLLLRPEGAPIPALHCLQVSRSQLMPSQLLLLLLL